MYRKPLAFFLFCSMMICASLAAAKDKFLVETSPESVEGAITIDDSKAKELFDQGVAFIDVRSKQAYEKGRVPDSVLLDIKESFNKAALAAEVALDQPLVIYCQGEKCARAAAGCKMALEWGYSEVYYYRSGFPGWKAAGYPVE